MVCFDSVLLGVATAPLESGSDATQWDVVIFISAVLLALGFSFLCSIAEAVLLSVTPSFIESLRAKHPKRASRLRKLKLDNVDQSLAAILTLNTIAHTVGAIVSGAKATIIFGSAWFGLFSAFMTLMILFLSEIIPKTLGAVYWTRLVGPTAFFVQGLIWSLFPMVWLSECLTKWISRGHKGHIFSRDELISLARIGEASGAMPKSESRVLRNLFRLGTLTAQDIMTPRTVVAGLAEESTLGHALKFVTNRPFSRLPLLKDGNDLVSGFVLRDDILMANARGESSAPLQSIRRDVLKVPNSILLTELFDLLLEKRTHIAIVLDEYGSTKGLVTLEDLMETLIGIEIIDETDSVVDMRALARERWKKRAKTMGLETEL